MNRKLISRSLAGAALALAVPVYALVNAGGLAWNAPVAPNNASIKEALGGATIDTTITDANTGGRAEITSTISNAAEGASLEIRIEVFNSKGRRVDRLIVSTAVPGDDPAVVASVPPGGYVPNFPPNGLLALRVAMGRVGPVVDQILLGQTPADDPSVRITGQLDAPVTTPALRNALRAGTARQAVLIHATTSTSYQDPANNIMLNFEPANYLGNFEVQFTMTP